MNVRKRLLILTAMALCILAGSQAHAACYESGEKLYDELNVCERMNNGKATVQQVYACAKASGYIMGIADALDGKDFERTNPFTSAQLKAVVLQALKDRASERNLCADILVREALTATFPKPQ